MMREHSIRLLLRATRRSGKVPAHYDEHNEALSALVVDAFQAARCDLRLAARRAARKRKGEG
jgi:hypothetical protein